MQFHSPYFSVLMVNIIFHEYAVAEDDPLPAIDGLRITGEAFPGKELQASGYSINGTTSCNFEVRFIVVVQHAVIFYQIPFLACY